jgi:exonuclease-1
VLKQVSIQKNVTIPSTYEDDFRRADLTFLHQRVWDPQLQRLVTLTPLPPSLTEGNDIDFIGPKIDNEIAKQVAEGTRRKAFLLDKPRNFRSYHERAI